MIKNKIFEIKELKTLVILSFSKARGRVVSEKVFIFYQKWIGISSLSIRDLTNQTMLRDDVLH